MQADHGRVFFMHIMKTAGTSFAIQINDNVDPDHIYPRPGVTRHMDQYWKIAEVRGLSPDQLAPIRFVCGHFPFLVGELVDATETITLLRDPIERTVSHLRHCRRHFAQHKGRSLEAIYDDAWHHPLLFRNYQVKQFALTVDDAPKAHNEDVEVDDARLDIALANLERVTVLGLTERYGEFLGEAVERYGWAHGAESHLQASPGAVEVSGRLRDRIASENAADVTFYERAVALYEERRARSRPAVGG